MITRNKTFFGIEIFEKNLVSEDERQYISCKK